MARTLKNTQAQAQTETQKTSSADLSRRRHMAINSLRKRGIEFPEDFEKLHTLVNITESAYYKRDNGMLTDDEASNVINDAVKRHQEEYDPLSNPNLL